jgi:hypothetical protein
MADFCKQCAEGMGFPADLAGLSTEEDTKQGLHPIVLCEGCGPIQVDHEGKCVSWDCYENHGVKPDGK